MNLKKTELEKLNRMKCQKRLCKVKASTIINSHYLCEHHYREIKPKKGDPSLAYLSTYKIIEN